VEEEVGEVGEVGEGFLNGNLYFKQKKNGNEKKLIHSTARNRPKFELAF